MSRDEMLSDVYERLTSRKFLLALMAIAFAVWNHAEGRMTAVELQQFLTVTVAAYTAGEAATDAAAAWHSSPDTTVKTTVTNVPPSEPTTTTKPPARKARPSRARPKGAV